MVVKNLTDLIGKAETGLYSKTAMESLRKGRLGKIGRGVALATGIMGGAGLYVVSNFVDALAAEKKVFVGTTEVSGTPQPPFSNEVQYKHNVTSYLQMKKIVGNEKFPFHSILPEEIMFNRIETLLNDHTVSDSDLAKFGIDSLDIEKYTQHRIELSKKKEQNSKSQNEKSVAPNESTTAGSLITAPIPSFVGSMKGKIPEHKATPIYSSNKTPEEITKSLQAYNINSVPGYSPSPLVTAQGEANPDAVKTAIEELKAKNLTINTSDKLEGKLISGYSPLTDWGGQVRAPSFQKSKVDLDEPNNYLTRKDGKKGGVRVSDLFDLNKYTVSASKKTDGTYVLTFDLKGDDVDLVIQGAEILNDVERLEELINKEMLKGDSYALDTSFVDIRAYNSSLGLPKIQVATVFAKAGTYIKDITFARAYEIGEKTREVWNVVYGFTTGSIPGGSDGVGGDGKGGKGKGGRDGASGHDSSNK